MQGRKLAAISFKLLPAWRTMTDCSQILFVVLRLIRPHSDFVQWKKSDLSCIATGNTVYTITDETVRCDPQKIQSVPIVLTVTAFQESYFPYRNALRPYNSNTQSATSIKSRKADRICLRFDHMFFLKQLVWLFSNLRITAILPIRLA